jgi:hypothetical protein
MLNKHKDPDNKKGKKNINYYLLAALFQCIVPIANAEYARNLEQLRFEHNWMTCL